MARELTRAEEQIMQIMWELKKAICKRYNRTNA